MYYVMSFEADSGYGSGIASAGEPDDVASDVKADIVSIGSDVVPSVGSLIRLSCLDPVHVSHRSIGLVSAVGFGAEGVTAGEG